MLMASQCDLSKSHSQFIISSVLANKNSGNIFETLLFFFPLKKNLFKNEFLYLTDGTIGRTGASLKESAVVGWTLCAVSSKTCGAVEPTITELTIIASIPRVCVFTWFTSYSMLNTNLVKIISQFCHPG